METKYVFYEKIDGKVQPVLQIFPFPFVWEGEPRVMNKVLGRMAEDGLYLTNPSDVDRLPEMYKGADFYCIKNPVDIIGNVATITRATPFSLTGEDTDLKD
jgi:hypothetical protein